MDVDFSDRVVIVTGAARGIVRVMVKAFVDAGAQSIVDRAVDRFAARAMISGGAGGSPGVLQALPHMHHRAGPVIYDDPRYFWVTGQEE